MKFIKNPSISQLDEVIEDLSTGGVIVYPTDTLYGIGVDIYNYDAVKKVFTIKSRSHDKPLSICAHDINQIKEIAETNDVINEIIDKLLPGPYTLLIKKKDVVSDVLTAGSEKIGIRIPNNEISSYLTRFNPITSTSANISDTSTPDNVQDISDQLGDKISCYIDVGRLNKEASTIIDLTSEYPSIIRKGAYDKELLDEILEMVLY